MISQSTFHILSSDPTKMKEKEIRIDEWNMGSRLMTMISF